MLRLLELSVGGALGPEAVCIERRHVCIFPGYHCQHCHPPPLKQSPLLVWSSPIGLSWLTGQLWVSCVCFPSIGVHTTTMSRIFSAFWGSYLGLRACKASNLLTGYTLALEGRMCNRKLVEEGQALEQWRGGENLLRMNPETSLKIGTRKAFRSPLAQSRPFERESVYKMTA